jgi:hypothetical protein
MDILDNYRSIIKQVLLPYTQIPYSYADITALPAIMQYSFSHCPSPIIAAGSAVNVKQFLIAKMTAIY